MRAVIYSLILVIIAIPIQASAAVCYPLENTRVCYDSMDEFKSLIILEFIKTTGSNMQAQEAIEEFQYTFFKLKTVEIKYFEHIHSKFKK